MSKSSQQSKNIDPESEKIIIRTSKRGWEQGKKNETILRQKYVNTAAEYLNEKESSDKIIKMLEKKLQEEKKIKDDAIYKLKIYEDDSVKHEHDDNFLFYNDDEIDKIIKEARIKTKKQHDERIAYFTNICK